MFARRVRRVCRGSVALGGSCLAERLSHYVRLSAGEQAGARPARGAGSRAAAAAPSSSARTSAPRELFIVRKGWLHSSVVLGNGSRQIMRFHFQGDILGLPLLAFADSPETVTAVTDVILCPFSRERLAALIGEHPRLGALILVAGRRRAGRARRPARLDRPHLGPGAGRRRCSARSSRACGGSALADDDAHPAAADPGGDRRRHRPHRGPRQPDDARPGRGRDHRAQRRPVRAARRGAAVSPKPTSSTAPGSRPAGCPGD